MNGGSARLKAGTYRIQLQKKSVEAFKRAKTFQALDRATNVIGHFFVPSRINHHHSSLISSKTRCNKTANYARCEVFGEMALIITTFQDMVRCNRWLPMFRRNLLLPSAGCRSNLAVARCDIPADSESDAMKCSFPLFCLAVSRAFPVT
jgi:hypothetical protein